MPPLPRHRRTVNGKTYGLAHAHSTKSIARKKSKSLRRDGINSVVLKLPMKIQKTGRGRKWGVYVQL